MLGRLLRDLFLFKSTATNPPESEPRVVALDDINCLVHGRQGWFLANRYDTFLGQALIVYGEYGEIEHRFLVSLLREGDHVIEVGANIGAHTVGLARHVGPNGRIAAIEPQPSICRVLNANLALNSLDNVSVHACGCGKRRGTLIVPPANYGAPNEHNSGGLSLAESGPGIPVPVIPLDDETFHDLAPVLIKVDVEGMELEVLQGAAGLIDRYRPLLYVENDRPDNSRALIDWILARNYRLWWHLPALFNRNNYFGEKQNRYAELVSINMLCQPAERTRPLPDLGREITDPGSRWDLTDVRIA